MMKASIAALVGGDQKVNNYMSSNKNQRRIVVIQIFQAPMPKTPLFQVGKEKSCQEQTQVNWSTSSHHFSFLAVITKTIVFYIRSPLQKHTRRAAVRFRISCSGQICHLPTSPPIGLETQET